MNTKIKISLFASVVAISVAACSPSSNGKEQQETNNPTETKKVDSTLTAKLYVNPTQKINQPIELTFTVYNHTDSTRKFCKWHTPFERLMSSYLDIKDENGTQPQYQGAMAKRIMPPPADSYISVAPGDSLSVKTDLLKAYALKAPGKYTAVYNATGISGLVVRDSVAFTVEK